MLGVKVVFSLGAPPVFASIMAIGRIPVCVVSCRLP